MKSPVFPVNNIPSRHPVACWAIGVILALLCGIAASPAFARNADGTLGLLIQPNNGVPAMLSGEVTSFITIAQGEAELAIEGPGGRFPVKVSWKPRPGGQFSGLCTLPDGVPLGLYALHATHGGTEDHNLRSVAVLAPPGDVYSFAHLSDTHIGSGRHKRSSTDIMADMVKAINASGATFCAITGDVTDGGAAEQFRDFISVMDTIAMPTPVCVGNHDRDGLNYEQFFGPLDYSFWYGRDGYLVFDTKDYFTAPDLGPQTGELETARRALKSARWSIGLSHRYESFQGMRSQLVLFVDNPLDYLIFGHWHRENSPEQRTVPWGRTRISVVPAGIDGSFRMIDVTAQGLLFRPFETPAATE